MQVIHAWPNLGLPSYSIRYIELCSFEHSALRLYQASQIYLGNSETKTLESGSIITSPVQLVFELVLGIVITKYYWLDWYAPRYEFTYKEIHVKSAPYPWSRWWGRPWCWTCRCSSSPRWPSWSIRNGINYNKKKKLPRTGRYAECVSRRTEDFSRPSPQGRLKIEKKKKNRKSGRVTDPPSVVGAFTFFLPLLHLQRSPFCILGRDLARVTMGRLK